MQSWKASPLRSPPPTDNTAEIPSAPQSNPCYQAPAQNAWPADGWTPAASEAEQPSPYTDAPQSSPYAGASQPDAPAKTAGDFMQTVKTTAQKVWSKTSELLVKAKPYADKACQWLVAVWQLFCARVSKKIRILIGAGLAFVVVLCVLIGVLTGGNGFVKTEGYVLLSPDGDEYVIVYNGKKTSETVSGYYSSSVASSLDGKVYAFVNGDENDALYVVYKGKLKKVASKVEDFTLSANGEGIAYVIKNDDGDSMLRLYAVKKGTSSSVTNSFDGSFVIAPNGKTVCYSVENDDSEYDIMYYNGSRSTKIDSGDLTLRGMANKGKYIYVVDGSSGDDILYSYNAKGKRTRLGEISSSSSAIYFNTDHTQVLFYNDSKSYIAAKGKEAQKIASASLYLMTPAGYSNVCYGSGYTTMTAKSLFNHAYCSYAGDVWFIRKNADKCVKLLSDAYAPQLDKTCEYVYYTDENDNLYVTKLSYGEKAEDKAVKLASDITDFAVTSDRKYVYYTHDGDLYRVNGKNGKGKTRVSADAVNDFYLNEKDVCFYLSDGDLYYSKNGKKGKRAKSDVEVLTISPTLQVLFATDDTLYLTNGTKTKKIMTVDLD